MLFFHEVHNLTVINYALFSSWKFVNKRSVWSCSHCTSEWITPIEWGISECLGLWHILTNIKPEVHILVIATACSNWDADVQYGSKSVFCKLDLRWLTIWILSCSHELVSNFSNVFRVNTKPYAHIPFAAGSIAEGFFVGTYMPAAWLMCMWPRSSE
mgnify:CR=1 FL=1